MSRRAELYIKLGRAHIDDMVKGTVPKGVKSEAVIALATMYYTAALAEMKWSAGVTNWTDE